MTENDCDDCDARCLRWVLLGNRALCLPWVLRCLSGGALQSAQANTWTLVQ